MTCRGGWVGVKAGVGREVGHRDGGQQHAVTLGCPSLTGAWLGILQSTGRSPASPWAALKPHLHALAALDAQAAAHSTQHDDAVGAGGDEGVLQRRQGVHHSVVAVQDLRREAWGREARVKASCSLNKVPQQARNQHAAPLASPASHASSHSPAGAHPQAGGGEVVLAARHRGLVHAVDVAWGGGGAWAGMGSGGGCGTRQWCR